MDLVNNKHHTLLPSIKNVGGLSMAPLAPPFAMCGTHNSEITQYCRTHQLPLCELCFLEHTYADPQMAGFGDNHDFVRIDKIINEAIDHMQKQLSSFDHII